MSPPSGIRDRLPDLLDELARSTPIEPAADEFDLHRPSALANANEPDRRWSRPLAAVAATIVITVAGAWVLAANRQNLPTLDPARPLLAEPVPESPKWYHVIASHLPTGFDHIALNQSGAVVSFEIHDLDTTRMLSVTLTRGPWPDDPSRAPITLDQARSATWTDPDAEYNISLPDGRQAGISCSMGPVPQGCPPIDGRVVDAEQMRVLLIALIDGVPVAELPPVADTLPHVGADRIRSATRAAVGRDEDVYVEAPHYGFSFVQYGESSKQEGFLSVRTITGLTPAPVADGERHTVSVDGRRSTWQVMADQSVWFVFDAPEAGLDLADRILDNAVAQYAAG